MHRVAPRQRASGILLLALLLPAGCGAEPDPGPTVVVVAIEALRHDYPERHGAPTLARLAEQGGRAIKLIPAFPSNSGPNQTALATGRLPGGSGVVNNRFLDRALGRSFEGNSGEWDAMVLAEPIGVTAERQGVPAAAIHWPPAEAGFRNRRIGRRSELDEDAPDAERVAEAVRWIAEDGPQAPRLILIYLEELDDVAHETGPDSDEVRRAVQRQDGHVRAILDALTRHRGRERSTLFVLGDHGITGVTKCVYLQAFLRDLGIEARHYASGATANLYLERAADLESALAALGRETQLLRVLRPAELPRSYGYLHPDRSGDLVLIGAPGVYFRDLGDRALGPARLPGVHGFEPEHPDMSGALVAWGRGVSPGTRWERIHVVDLHPTICDLLGITPPPDIDGRAFLPASP